MIEERGILRRDGAVHFQALIGPGADPIAVVEVGMAGIAIANECLVMAAAGTERPRPALMAVVLGIDISPGKKSVLLFSIHSGGHIAKNMFVGVHKAMAGRDIAGWTNTNHA